MPRGWNQCTTWELEQIAAAIMLETLNVGRYHPFSWEEVKVRILFAINRLEILSQTDDGFMVRIAPPNRPWWKRIFSPFHYSLFTNHYSLKNTSPFPLPVGHVHAMTTEFLSWLDDEKAEPLLRAPYPPITPLLDGYVWKEYRQMQDWMDEYVSKSNQLATLRPQHPQYQKILAAQQAARDKFLKILLREGTNSPLTSNPSPLTTKNVDDVRWQVILIWWSGLMKVLMRKYPRCFKQQKPGKGKRKQQRRQNPLDIYTSIIATMQTKTHLSEETIDKHTSYQVILEQLERIAREREEMEKMRK